MEQANTQSNPDKVGEIKEVSCCICLEKGERVSERGDEATRPNQRWSPGKIKKLPCCTSSLVHKDCINLHVNHSGSKCPICRQDIEFEEVTENKEYNVCKERLYETLIVLCFMCGFLHIACTIMSLIVMYKIYEITGDSVALCFTYIGRIVIDFVLISVGYFATFDDVCDLLNTGKCVYHLSCPVIVERKDRLSHSLQITFRYAVLETIYIVMGDLIHYILYNTDSLIGGSGMGWTYAVILIGITFGLILIPISLVICWAISRYIYMSTCHNRGFRSCIDYMTPEINEEV